MEGSFRVDPNTEVIGQAILSTIMGVGDEVVPIMKQHGIENLQPDHWYPLTAWLAVMDVISGGKNPMFDQVAIGMKIIETAIFPPEINSVTSVLYAIDVAYHLNHRNGEIGHYHAENLDERQIKVVAETPYPDFFNYGILYGAAKKFLPPGGQLVVRHDDKAACTRKGDSSCTYYISW